MPSLRDFPILQYFAEVFEEITIFPSKVGIEFSIGFMPRTSLLSKVPYKMSTPELKELQMQPKEFLKKGYIHPSVSPWGSTPILFVKKNDGTMRLCIEFK